jgi:lactate dehydrogenase-like 2-hydroxyacid dehydrogenase
MARPKLFVTRKLPDAVEARLRRDYDPLLNENDRSHGPDDLVRLAQGVDGVLTCSTERWDAAVVERLPERVGVIASYSVGYEHLDLAACRRRGIVATNTPDVLTEATADIALLCLLGAARRAWEGESMLRSHRWERWRSTELLGLELTGRVLGIVGMGRIGQATARRARGFGMAIHYHNRHPLPEDKAQGAVYHGTLESLLPRCHFLSLHCPGGAETHHLVNTRTIGLLPHGAVVVNTARGTLVDDEALIAALRSGRLFAAGLDVYANEPNIHPGYHDLPNCFLLPHLGSATVETRDAMGFRALDNLDAFFAGRQAPDALT